MKEAHASPAGRGFGPMPPGPGRIPCRIARLVGFERRRPKGIRPARLYPAPLCMETFQPWMSPHPAHPRVD